ncbi:right-handed parallel beta-helix repeat-containing protein [Endozoicomonas sp. SM1973]|uniref:Right-handed parallel beta-helix repeat-containing protein n=1 Tax=Spartinivicinus marinus TaxID=2994442 RepID=A0A853I6S6_9GAMM|nr:right-handed parallel beta-helix repeat-containing protein [Spartinivicinus marinus]MCX4026047.1 right-handed parallel beta-helix repeat-containing protein [Spartinivicinus marinus]NYZ69023.1 right-handed parallel beta-helix repeat-containing protein [Spartinivicinus marinus]
MNQKSHYLGNILLIILLCMLSACKSDSDNDNEDSTPDPFAFLPVNDVEISTLTESAPVTIQGINTASSVHISEGEFSIAGGNYTSSPSTINNGQSISVRIMSSAQQLGTASTTLTIGGVSAVFTVTSRGNDNTPDNFQFSPITNAERSTNVESSSVIIQGINTPAQVKINVGEYSINGGSYTNAPATIENGQSIRVRLMSSQQYESSTSSTLTIGGISSDFNVTTRNIASSDDCFFSAQDIQANEVVYINCQLNLRGQSINLPSNVSFVNDGGLITNGTLTFNTGSIDGELLNASLTVEGVAHLTRPEFTLIKERWDIMEGQVDEAVARNNKAIMRQLIKQIKLLGAKTLKINQLDAYFYPSEFAIHPVSGKKVWPHDAPFELPSDFTLLMSDDTFIRVYKNDMARYELVRIGNGKNRTGDEDDPFTDVKNVKVIGGNLIGDRQEHKYTDEGKTHEWGHLIDIVHGENIEIDRVTMRDASGDGIHISGQRYGVVPNNTDRGSRNVLVKNCLFDRNRRNQISLVYGYDITIEKNHFKNSKVNLATSNYIAPGLPIDIEPEVYQEVYDVKIINNTHEGKGSFHVYKSTPMPTDYNSPHPYISPFNIATEDRGGSIILEGNKMEGAITMLLGNGVRIRHNQISKILTGRASAFDKKELIFDNIIHDNIIDGKFSRDPNINRPHGILAAGRDIKIHHNKIRNVSTGIYIGAGSRADELGGLKDTQIYDNDITANNFGIAAINGVDNVSIENNYITVVRSNSSTLGVGHIRLGLVNNKEQYKDYTFSIASNTFRGRFENQDRSYSSIFNNVTGIKITNNDFSGGISLIDVNNSEFSSNTIYSNTSNGFYNLGNVNNSSIVGNKVKVEQGPFVCFKQKENTFPGINLVINNNECQQGL